MTFDKLLEQVYAAITIGDVTRLLKAHGFAIMSDRQVQEFGAPIAHVTVLASSTKYPALLIHYTYDEDEGDLIYDQKVLVGRLVPVTTYQFHETKEAV